MTNIEKLKALALAAPGIKPWEERAKEAGAGYGNYPFYMQAEIDELRAKLVSTLATLELSDSCLVQATSEAAELRADNERLRADPHYSTRRDAERFRRAIALEDNAEALYAAVLSHAPDGEAIRAAFDEDSEAPDSHVIPPPRGTGSQQDSDVVDLFRLTLGTLALHDWREAEKIGAQYRAIEAELATRCRVEGGNTSDKPDDFRSAPWYLTACKMGNAFYNLSQRDDLPPGWNETARGLVEEWDEARKSIGSGGAAGTDKDAERYRTLRSSITAQKYPYYQMEYASPDELDEWVDEQTKAGKPT